MAEATWEIRQGDALALLREMPAESVQCVVTSPPYWGLRDYGTAAWEGGDAGCNHEKDRLPGVASSGLEGGKGTTNHQQEASYRSVCGKCGARRIDSQLGLEPTPEAYVAKMVEVFREVRRTLRTDGTVFLNLGDSFSSATYGKLRYDLTEKEQSLALQLLWEASRRQTGEGPLSAVLPEGVEEGEPRKGAGTESALLQEEQAGVLGADQGGEEATAGENAFGLGREVRLLPREGTAIPLPRSHQGRRSARVSEEGRASRSLETCDSGGSASGQVPDSVLELQRRSRALRILSSLEFDLSDIPLKARDLLRVTLKPKDLVGIPWRVAFALQADGWYLRSDIIWAKPNPMPESVTDRPTKAHEYVFLLTKSARYYFDAEAVREPAEYGRKGRNDTAGTMRRVGGDPQKVNAGDATWTGCDPSAGRNIRSVWTIATQPFPEAHFATFPEKLVEPCVKAGSKPGDTVLDPFAGSGTVGVVALRLGRSFLGMELSPAYCEMARRRIIGDAELLNAAAEIH